MQNKSMFAALISSSSIFDSSFAPEIEDSGNNGVDESSKVSENSFFIFDPFQ